MKKLLSIAIVAVFVAFNATPVLAHGSCHGGQRNASYSVCSTQSCTLTGLHTHNNRIYAPHYYNDGHTYHAYCEYEDCTVAGYHSHDGVYCFGNTAYGGRGCR